MAVDNAIFFGATIAALSAWLSIYIAIRLKAKFRENLHMRTLKVFGGLSVITIALIIWRVPLPGGLPLFLFFIGIPSSIIVQKWVGKREKGTLGVDEQGCDA
jgi:hypothetical protein